MKTKRFSYTIRVIGHAWQGFQAVQEKRYDGAKLPRTADECRPHFGDLQSVEDFQIVKTETETENLGVGKMRQTITETVIKPFADETSEDVCAACA